MINGPQVTNVDSRFSPYKKNLSSFLKNLNYITSFNKDSIFIDKKTPRLYKIKDGVFDPSADNNIKISPPLINDYLNLRRWGYLPDYKKISRYIKFPSAVLSLRVSEACNLSCKYCYNKTNLLNNEGVKYMPPDTALESVDFFFSNFKNRDMTIVFFGGEPLLNFATIKETINYAKIKSKGTINFKIVTNGTVMNKKILKTIIQDKIKVMVSMDLPAFEHKRNRRFKDGKDSFKIVKKNAKLLSRHIGRDLLIRCILAHDSNTSFSEIYRSFRQLNIPTNNFLIEYESSNCRTDRIKRLEIGNEKETIINEQRKKIIKNATTYLYPKEIIGSYLSVIVNGRDPLPECMAITNGVSVNPLGEIYFCDLVANLKEFYLGDIKKGMSYSKVIKIKNKYSKTLPLCRDCWASSFCSRFCPLTRIRKNFKKIKCTQRKKDFLKELKFFLNMRGNQVERLIRYSILSSNNRADSEKQISNLKICFKTYKTINRTNKYIKPINIFPY